MDQSTSEPGRELQAKAIGNIRALIRRDRKGRGGHLDKIRIGASLLDVRQYMPEDQFNQWIEAAGLQLSPETRHECMEPARPLQSEYHGRLGRKVEARRRERAE